MKIEDWEISKFKPYIQNPRRNDSKVESMARIISVFGFRIPVIAKSDGSVIDGHLRLKAAEKLNLRTVPVICADDMTDAQIKAFRVAANKAADFAEWDIKKLVIELDELEAMRVDLTETGFTKFEIEQIRSAADILNPDNHDSITPDRFGQGSTKIKIVIHSESLELFELAMDSTGLQNREEALKKICEVYLGKER